MNSAPIMVIDSGIGGISVLSELIKLIPNENYVYFGDNGNAPYGNKTIEKLKNLTEKTCKVVKEVRPKILVVGCNTLSVTLLDFIKERCRVPVFGVFPPVDDYKAKWGKTILLATEKTCDSINVNKNIFLCPLKRLAEDIEKNAFLLNNVNVEEQINTVVPKNLRFQTVILGCTHYVFVKNKIFNHFYPKNIISGNEVTAINVLNFLKSTKTIVNSYRNNVSFVGENADFNRDFYEKVVVRLQNNQ